LIKKELEVRTFKQVVAWILLVISVLGIIGAFVGIVGSWVVRNQVTVATVSLLTAGETAVNAASQSINRIDNRLELSHTNITALEKEIVNAGATLTENSLVGMVVSNKTSDETALAIGEARATIQTIVETIHALDDAIQAANQIPFVNLDGFLPSLVADLVSGIEKLETDIATFRATVEERREGLISESVGVLTGLTSEMSGNIGEIRTSVGGVTTQLTKTSDTLATAKVTLPRLFTMIAVFASVFLLFVGVAFTSLLLHSWVFAQNPDLTFHELLAVRKAKALATVVEEA
jgi:hypothetical protein